MLVTVIIVNHNGRAHLEKCIRTLFTVTTTKFELIVVDNDSTDGSAQEIAEQFPDVKVIFNKANLGFAQGNNEGARFAHGDYLALLNPDTIVTSGWLEALINALEADPGAGLATSKILLLDQPDRINTAGNNIHLSGLTLCRGMGLSKSALAEPAEVGAVSGAAFVIRRELFNQLGGFDPAFFMYMEDADLSFRARIAGHRCLYVPDSIVYHDYSLQFGPRKIYYEERNRYLMLLKGLRWSTLLLLLPALLLAEMVTWGYVILRDRRHWSNKLHAYGYIIKQWSKITAGRRIVQSMRRVTDKELIGRAVPILDYDQTGDSGAARLAHLLFDPLFTLWQRVMLLALRG